jgi:hypothetical protein
MKRLSIIRACVASSLTLGIVLALASSAEASPSGQLRAYMREGLSLERAQVALATQSQVEAAELPVRLEEALGASFAGMWFEPSRGKFSIGVVSGASRRAAEQVVAQAGLAGVVSYVPVRSTWSQLISAKGEWKAKLAHLGGQQFSTGLIASHNAVSVRLSSSVSEQERALLERKAASFRTNVLITVVPPEALVFRPRNSQCEWRKIAPEVPPYAFCSKPIAAGVLITPNGTLLLKTWCTAGPLAKLANPATLAAELETLLITAGHCLAPAELEKWFTSPHPGVEHIEIGPRIAFLEDLAGDYGDIEVRSNWLLAGVTPALAQITNYQDNGLREARNVIGEEASMQNATFCKQGATSGEQCGTIKEVSTLELFHKPPDELVGHVEGLVRTNACGEPGDSGGPYATLPLSGNGVHILGTEVGGALEKCGLLTCPAGQECISQYEPIKTSLAGLKLTLLTTANQTRHGHGWLINGNSITSATKTHSKVLVLLSDSKATGGEVKVHCKGFDAGTVGPGAADLVESITAELLGTKKLISCSFDKVGACKAGTTPTFEAVHLPWKTELVLNGTEVRDLFLADGSGAPGWAVTCTNVIGGTTTDTCEEEAGKPYSAGLSNVSEGVLATFDSKTPSAKCSIGGAEAGHLEGTDLTESPSSTEKLTFH